MLAFENVASLLLKSFKGKVMEEPLPLKLLLPLDEENKGRRRRKDETVRSQPGKTGP